MLKRKNSLIIGQKDGKSGAGKHMQKKMFLNVVLPLAILIDLVNYFIIGDTAYAFFTFTHLFSVALNILVLAILIILGTGFASWNYNESKYWGILRKNNRKLQ